VAFYSVYPVGFFVSTIGFGVYLVAAGGRALAVWAGSRRPGSPSLDARWPDPSGGRAPERVRSAPVTTHRPTDAAAGA
jgi:hypothetical protein